MLFLEEDEIDEDVDVFMPLLPDWKNSCSELKQRRSHESAFNILINNEVQRAF